MHYRRRGSPELRLQKVPRAMEAFGIASLPVNLKSPVSGKPLNETGDGRCFRSSPRLSAQIERSNNPGNATGRRFSRTVWLLLCLLPLSLGAASLADANPIPVIFDTDIGNDVDDALALAMLHALESRGEARLLAVTITKDNRYAAPYIDLVNTFYGRPDIPVGMVRNGKTPEDSAMIRVPAERKNPD